MGLAYIYIYIPSLTVKSTKCRFYDIEHLGFSDRLGTLSKKNSDDSPMKNRSQLVQTARSELLLMAEIRRENPPGMVLKPCK